MESKELIEKFERSQKLLKEEVDELELTIFDMKRKMNYLDDMIKGCYGILCPSPLMKKALITNYPRIDRKRTKKEKN
jgi:hypothetical protein